MEKQNTATAQEEKAEQLEKVLQMDRRNRRARLRIRHNARRTPFARVRSGLPTGTTPHFKAWMADLSAKSVLQMLKLDALADGTAGAAASGFALLYIAGYKSVWDLSRANVADLLRVSGVGPAKLSAVEKYLTDRNVRLAWTAA